MSQFIWKKPNKHNVFNTFLKYLPTETSIRYCIYRMCCNRNNLQLPDELWKCILYQLCDDKNINPTNILEWLDNYIKSKEQQIDNPMIMFDKWENALEKSKIKTEPDISYIVLNIPVKLKELKTHKSYGMWYEAIIPVGKEQTDIDLVLGIEDNDHITNIILQYGRTLANATDDNDSIKFTLSNNCSYSILKNYMPLLTYSLPYYTSTFNDSVALHVRCNEPLSSINVLCGYMNNKIRYELGNYHDDKWDRAQFKYKRCIYDHCHLFITS